MVSTRESRYTRITLVCENLACPRPNREFVVGLACKNQRFCCRSCASKTKWMETWIRQKERPELTKRRFAQIAKILQPKEVTRTLAYAVLVEGKSNREVAESSGYNERYVGKQVAVFRAAIEVGA